MSSSNSTPHHHHWQNLKPYYTHPQVLSIYHLLTTLNLPPNIVLSILDLSQIWISTREYKEYAKGTCAVTNISGQPVSQEELLLPIYRYEDRAAETFGNPKRAVRVRIPGPGTKLRKLMVLVKTYERSVERFRGSRFFENEPSSQEVRRQYDILEASLFQAAILRPGPNPNVGDKPESKDTNSEENLSEVCPRLEVARWHRGWRRTGDRKTWDRWVSLLDTFRYKVPNPVDEKNYKAFAVHVMEMEVGDSLLKLGEEGHAWFRNLRAGDTLEVFPTTRQLDIWGYIERLEVRVAHRL